MNRVWKRLIRPYAAPVLAGTAFQKRCNRALAPVFAAALITVLTGPAVSSAQSAENSPSADDVDAATEEVDQATSLETGARPRKPAPWRGSRFSWRHEVGQTTLEQDYLTYDPYYAMVFTFEPRWWFTENLYLKARLDVTQELTQSNVTTYDDEAWVSDLGISVGMARFFRVPVLGVDLSADLALTAPTSKVAWSRNLVMTIRPSLRLSRSFDLLGGLAIGTTLRTGPSLHTTTTAVLENPRIRCPGRSEGCGEYQSTGVRNPFWRLSQTFDVWLGVTDWFSASVATGYYVQWLYGLPSEALVSNQPQADQPARYSTLLALELTFKPLKAIEVGVGYQAFMPQLAPDSSYYNPFDNPYSVLFVDLRLDVDGLIAQITGRDSERSMQNDL
jgi:hypothetical protein